MKTVCVLMTFIFVNVLAEINMNNYKQQVFLTNKLIQKVYEHNNAKGNGLENVIKTFVGICTLGHLNLMFAIPDRLQYTGQMQISYILQENLLQTIHHTFSFPVPEPHQFPENLNLEELGNERRDYTGRALENIFRSGLKYNTIYGAGARGMEFKLIDICHFIALYKNAKFLSIDNSLGHINTAEDDIFGRCTLTSTLDNSTTYYKKVVNQIIEVFEHGSPKKPLLDSASDSASTSSSS
ncbi:uncharacterized protein LOC126833244 [Adelges cooleyi]|uniref:uncharacterized protein LOC126833244 n=1 Tax=Adelges cooleyi TaxID=133065 RepID=UPI00217F442B|nr:uncharacterized protein LOC126833244 [Adelges cooleyi]